jgi:hypothetical protein
MIEVYVWIASLFLAASAHLTLSLKYAKINPHSSAVPMINVKFFQRLTATEAINYTAFGLFGIFAVFAFPVQLATALVVMKSWYIVEIFIFWNIRTAFLIFMNIGRLKVKV